MQYKGVLRKMKTELTSQVQYFMEFEDDFIHMTTKYMRFLEKLKLIR